MYLPWNVSNTLPLYNHVQEHYIVYFLRWERIFQCFVLLILVMTCLYSLSYFTTLNTHNLTRFYCRIMIHTKTITRKYIFTYRRAPKIDHKSVIQLSLINIRSSSIISVILKMIISPWNSYLISCIQFCCLINILVYLVLVFK